MGSLSQDGEAGCGPDMSGGRPWIGFT